MRRVGKGFETLVGPRDIRFVIFLHLWSEGGIGSTLSIHTVTLLRG